MVVRERKGSRGGWPEVGMEEAGEGDLGRGHAIGSDPRQKGERPKVRFEVMQDLRGGEDETEEVDRWGSWGEYR